MKGPNKNRFEEIFATGRRANGELIRISALPGTGLVGIATSKKIGDRPDRNRAKRRISEAVRTMSPKLDRRYDYVVIVSASAKTATFERIQDEVRPLFTKAVSRWVSESLSS